METDFHAQPVAVDALLPQEMAEKCERIGVQKTRLDRPSLIVLAVLAGAFIGFGAMFSTVVAAGTDGALPFGMGRLMSGIAFSLGLILVIAGGAELFTGNNLIVMAWANRRVSSSEVLRAWVLVYIGNFVGATATALLVFLAEGYLYGNGTIGAAALEIGQAKASLSFFPALIRGVLGNVLVCLAVWLCYGARTTTDKILAIVPPISAFVAAGFEHSVANMYLLPFSLLVKYGASSHFWIATGLMPETFSALTPGSLVANLVPVTLGNVIGGGVLIGAVYWFVYLRHRPVPAQIMDALQSDEAGGR
jgi:formate transporter